MDHKVIQIIDENNNIVDTFKIYDSTVQDFKKAEKSEDWIRNQVNIYYMEDCWTTISKFLDCQLGEKMLKGITPDDEREALMLESYIEVHQKYLLPNVFGNLALNTYILFSEYATADNFGKELLELYRIVKIVSKDFRLRKLKSGKYEYIVEVARELCRLAENTNPNFKMNYELTIFLEKKRKKGWYKYNLKTNKLEFESEY